MILAALFLVASAHVATGQSIISPPSGGAEAMIPKPTAKDWADLAKLPDWSGLWFPDVRDQTQRIETDRPPWTPKAAANAAQQTAEEIAGRPRLPFVNCLPMGMPSWMLINHNPMEVLFTPGRVTLLGESDGSRLRRIYTDGRQHPDDPDLTFHGHSIGRWEGEALVVDTVGVLPEVTLAVSEAVAVPLNGDMHVVERIALKAPDLLVDELTIEAPAILTRPWKTQRIFHRERRRAYDIVEGSCLQGNFTEGRDKDGNAVFIPLDMKNGNASARHD